MDQLRHHISAFQKVIVVLNASAKSYVVPSTSSICNVSRKVVCVLPNALTS